MAAKKKEQTNIVKRVWNAIRSQLTLRRVIILVIVLLVVGFAWNKVFGGNGEDVQTAEIKRGEIKEELILSGEIVADEHAQMSFETAGEISYVGVKEGDEVWKGQLLSKLDTINLNSSFERAKADLRSAEATLDRVHDDVKDNDDDESFTEKETRTTAEVAKDKAYEAYKIAERNLRGGSLFAPFAGVVTYLANPFSGVYVLPTTMQVEVVNPETIYFEVSADQTEVTSLSEGQRVQVVLDSFEDKEFEGRIDNISLTPKAGEVGTVYKVRVVFDDPSLDNIQFRIGMTGEAKFVTADKSDVLYVPNKFVNTDTDGKYVNLSEKNSKVYVKVGLEGEDNTEISGDVKEGDTVFD